jgi:glycosyltransferase involved in cell wall biosynthesis
MVDTLPKLLHVASCHKIGLTNQEVQRALAFNVNGTFELKVLSGENEQTKGLKDQLYNHSISFSIIRGLDHHSKVLYLIKECIKELNYFAPDIVALTTNWHLFIFGISKLFVRKKPKLVYTIHGFRNQSPLKGPIFRVIIGMLLLLFASLVIAPSNWVYQNFAFLKSRITVIPLGISEYFSLDYQKPNFTKPIIFIFASNFRSGKGHESLIVAFAKYFQANSLSTVKLYLPGDGIFLKKMQALVGELDLTNRIIFPGNLTFFELQSLYTKAHFAIIPSISETFGFCISEPLAMGRIVISNKVGVAIDLIEPMKNGFLFDNPNQINGLMEKVLSLPTSDLEVISKNAYETAKSLRWQKVVATQSEKFMTLLKIPCKI